MMNWINRLNWIVNEFGKEREKVEKESSLNAYGGDLKLKWSSKLRESFNFVVRQVTHHTKVTFVSRAAISRMQTMTNLLRKSPPEVIKHCLEFERCLLSLIIMLYPYAPHLSSEFWSIAVGSGKIFNTEIFSPNQNVWEQRWPKVDPDALFDLEFFVNEIPCGKTQFDGRKLGDLAVEECLQLALKEAKVQKNLRRMPVTSTNLHKVPEYGAQLFLTRNQTQIELQQVRMDGVASNRDDLSMRLK